MYTYDTADTRLGVGTNGQILSADSAEATGLKWIDHAASFAIVQADAGTSPTADVASDTLSLTSADGSITVTGDATADSINFAAREASASVSGVVTTGTQTMAGAKTWNGSQRFNSDVLIQEQGGTDLATLRVAALSAARVYTIPDAGADTSFAMLAGAQTVSGAKTFTASPVISGVNLLFSTANVGRDTGVSGSLTDCPSNGYFNFLNTKTGIGWSANSASSGLSTIVDSATSITFKNGSTSLLGISSTQLNAFKKMHFGTGENNIFDFASGSTTTTNSTPTNLWTFDSTAYNNWVFKIVVEAVCRRSDTGAEFGSFHKSFLVSRESSTTTLRNTTSVHADVLSTLTTATIDCNISGATIQVRATGETSKTLKWTYRTWLQIVST